MSLQNELSIEEDEKWTALCRTNGWTCERCGTTPPKSERDIYFSRKLCGYCAYMIDKIDRE